MVYTKLDQNQISIKNYVKYLAGVLPQAIVEKVYTWNSCSKFSSELQDASVFNSREELWKSVIDSYAEFPIVYVELGVHEGYSIKTIAAMNDNDESRFVGLDSFERLPHDWISNHSKGCSLWAEKFQKLPILGLALLRDGFKIHWNVL